MNKLLIFIRAKQNDVTLGLFLAAGLIGILSQRLVPADRGAEMLNLARSLADHGTYANPFVSMPTGPTAANPPLYPLLLAVFIKVLRAPALISIAVVVTSNLANAFSATLLPRVSQVFYGDPVPGVFASLLWLASMQSIPGWDTNLTVAGILFFVVLTAPMVKPAEGSVVRAAIAGLLAGLLFLLNPSSVLIVLPWLAFLLWRKSSDKGRAIGQGALIVGLLTVFIAGWCARNERALGGFVTRTNLGMTLYASNNDCAQSSMFRDQMNGCYQARHPNTSVEEAQTLMKLGEVKYDRERIADTKSWISDHRTQFMRLTARRLLEFWFPAIESVPATIQATNSAEILNAVRPWVEAQNFYASAIWVVTALSLPGLMLMARRRQAVLVFILAVSAIYPILYYVVVSDMRYRYPMLWLSLLPAGFLIAAVLEGSSLRTRSV